MAGYVRNARIKIMVEGKLLPYTDAEWVIFTPSGFPMGFLRVERKHLKHPHPVHYVADPEKAFADFWSYRPGRSALQAAMNGYRIELVGPERRRELLNQHAGLDVSYTTGEEETA